MLIIIDVFVEFQLVDYLCGDYGDCNMSVKSVCGDYGDCNMSVKSVCGVLISWYFSLNRRLLLRYLQTLNTDCALMSSVVYTIFTTKDRRNNFIKYNIRHSTTRKYLF